MLQVIDDTGVSDWAAVEHFAESGADDTVFHVDCLRRRGAVRSGGAAGRRVAAPVRGGAAEGRRTCGCRCTGPAAASAATSRPGQVRVLKTSVPYIVAGGEPHAGGRRRPGRGHRGRQAARAAGAALARPGGHRRGLRGADQAGRAGDRPGALRRAPTRGGVRVLVVPYVAGDEVGPDPPGRPDPAARVARPDQRLPRRTAAGRHPDGDRTARVPVDHRGDQRAGPAPVPGRGRPQGGAARGLPAVRPAGRRPGGHRLAVRPVGAGARGERRAGPDPRASTWPRRSACSCSRRTRRPADAARRCSGCRWRRPRWCSPTSTRSGCGNERRPYCRDVDADSAESPTVGAPGAR